MERLKVLISAYACEPGQGSEPEVGWQWALQMARFHDVTVLTTTSHEEGITKGLRDIPAAVSPRFAYFNLRPPLDRLKKHHRLYNPLWQRAAWHVIARLLKSERFDLLHHVTYAAARFHVAVLGHATPAIFGPVGGLESMPREMLPWRHPVELAKELARNASNVWQRRGFGLRRKLRASAVTLASTVESQAVFAALGTRSRLMPTIGLHTDEFSAGGIEPKPIRPLRLLFAGRLLFWKGLDLALHALHRSDSDATLTLVGGGEFRPTAERLIRDLRLEGRVELVGRVDRERVLRMYSEYDVLLYPSLHDSGAFVLIEAMASGLPAICLKCGGPGVAVVPGTGIAVPLGRRTEVIEALAQAIAKYARDPDLVREHGQNARAHIRSEYDWKKKGEAMNEIYWEVAERREEAR